MHYSVKVAQFHHDHVNKLLKEDWFSHLNINLHFLHYSVTLLQRYNICNNKPDRENWIHLYHITQNSTEVVQCHHLCVYKQHGED